MIAIVNGRVWRSAATAVAVRDDRIAAVGSDRDILGLVGKDARAIDARGASIIPAFNDAHLHFVMGSRGLAYLDLFGIETPAEIERRIRERAATSEAAWLLGRGWFYSAFPGGMPTLAVLDRLVPDRPAYIESFDTHCAWVNSLALAAAGIDPASHDGVLKERAMEDFERHLPQPALAEDLESLRAGMRLAAERGIGSVQEASRGQDELHLFRALDLTVRVRLAFDMNPGLAMSDWERRLDAYESVQPPGILKAFADGVVESRTAALSEPYAGSDERGAPLWEPGELAAAIGAADRRGWQVEVHAIGDAAIRDALDAFETTTHGRRHRIEHIEAPDPRDIPRFARLGVVASMQPQHAAPHMLEVWKRQLGPERSQRGWPWKQILDSGGRLAFGTDWPVVALDPFASLAEAMRTLTLDEALAAWTSGAAYAEHAEHEKGGVRAGMLADLAVLDRDLTVASREEVARTKVEATVVNGRLVYER